MPERIQLRRAKGWRKPAGAVVVTRGTRWGNPYRVGDPGVPDAATAVRLYARMMNPYTHNGPPVNETKLLDYEISIFNLRLIEDELRGRDLCCWCKPGEPCHADWLIEAANGPDIWL
ncbi:MAG: DUF4326 domain-containing protein [Paracoccaceae bacterium]|nr:DUF4326 domain-containing protein [Paracoccaceae bacterium]